MNNRNIPNDPRTPVAPTMYVHQFKQQRIFPIAKEDDIEVMATFKAIVEELGEAGYKTTAVPIHNV